MISTLLYLYNTIKGGDVLALTDSLECRDDFLDVNIILPTYGVGILHLAVGIEPLHSSSQCSKVILKNGGDPNLRSDEGLTPVHIAANWGRLDNLKMLLAWGGDISVRDTHNKTPYDYAMEEGHWDICDFLLNTAADYLHDSMKLPSYMLALESEFVTTDNIATECDQLEKPHRRNSRSCCRKSQMVRDWCFQNLDTSMLMNESKQWNSKLSYTIPLMDNLSLNTEDTEEYEYSLAMIPCGAIDPSPLEIKINEEMSGIGRIEVSCNSDNAIYSCLFSENERISSNMKVNLMRNSLFDQFSLPGSPTNIVHRNYSNKTSLKKIYSTNKHNKIRITLGLTDDQLELEINNSEGLSELIHIEDESMVTKHKDVGRDTDGVQINNLMCRTSSIEDKCSKVSGEQEENLQKEVSSQLTHHMKLPPELSEDGSCSESKSSLAASVDCDPVTLRLELTQCGYNPGPINHSTKRLYLKKLKNLRRNPIKKQYAAVKVYSVELQKTLGAEGWYTAEWREAGGALERAAAVDFGRREAGGEWREGVARTSFTYLLLDPRVTRDLPSRAHTQPHTLVWQTFVDSIFYVGKGKRSRPYSHLYQAIDLWKRDLDKCQVANKKVQHILDVWKSGSGVVCLHVFQNVIPAEAYTYEAAMIDVLRLINLKNLKAGNYYGVVSSWPLKDRRRLGVYLLYKAMQIFLSEGERQLRPEDLD